MHDHFSEGGVYYGRTALALLGIIAISVLLHLI